MLDSIKPNLSTSIIIPTYNRRNLLKRVLTALFSQTYPQDKYEIIVVDDGSTDGTGGMVRRLEASCSLRYFRQRKEGLSAARNYGIKQARGEIIIFIDSDILVDSHFVEEHLDYHRRYPRVVVKGPVVHTHTLVHPIRKRRKLKDISMAFFAGGNCSVEKKTLLEAGLFDEDFKEYGWEDLELGIRLKKQGLRAVTNKRAVGYHYRKKQRLADLPVLCAKERMRGRTAVLFYRKHRTFEVKYMTHISYLFFALDWLLNWNKWMNKKWGKNLLLWLEKHNSRILLSFLIKIVTSHAYLDGVREALANGR